MKCKLCHKNVRSISHWAREHKKWLRSRPRKRRKAPSLPRSGPVHRGRKREVHLTEAAAVQMFGSHYCPVCGKAH